MPLDKDALRFQAKVAAIAQEHFNASCEGREAEPFLDLVHQDYLKAGSSSDPVGWIKSRLVDEFLCVEAAPRWVEEEPAWPFLNGRPMVFIAQHSLSRNHITENRLTWNEVVYVFGARVELAKGYRVEYRVVVQHPDIEGSGER